MAAVSFYKFAAAVMELLEPEKYNFTRKTELDVPSTLPGTTDSLVTQVLSTATTEIKDDASGLINGSPAIGTSASIEAESKTVATVAEYLTNAIANASEDKLIKVADAIKEAAVETSSVAPLVLSVTSEVANAVSKPPPTIAETTQLVQTTVAALATQTTKEIKQAETLTDPATIFNPIEKALSTLETKATETVTAAITDKIKEKSEASLTAVPVGSSAEVKAETVSTPNIQTETSEKTKPVDFWELFPELDISGSEYYDEIADLYNYMQNGTLMDILNPANDLNLRYGLMTTISGSVGDKTGREAETNNRIRESRNESEEKDRQAARAERDADRLRQTELEKWQLQQRQQLAERIAAERLKEAL